MTIKQEKLNKLYETFTKEVKEKVSTDFSLPFYIDLVGTNSINTEVMICGKETHTWDGKYANLLNKNQRLNTQFFQCFRKWLGKEDSVYVWNNLSKMDYKGGSILNAPKEEQNFVLQKSAELLKEELNIIQPKIIIFVSGWRYDFIIKKYLNGKQEEFSNESGITKEQLCKWKLDDFKSIKAFRTYHPVYLNYNPELKKKIMDILSKEIDNAKNK